MTDIVLRGARWLVSALRVIAGTLLVLSVAINFANVIGRYFFSASIYWAEEIMLFLMVGCVFSAMAPSPGPAGRFAWTSLSA